MNGFEIKEKRKKLGITQSELASLIGVSLKTIQNYESGEVIPETKKEILRKYLNIDKIDYAEENRDIYNSKNLYEQLIKEKDLRLSEKDERILELKNHLIDKDVIIKSKDEKIKELETNLTDMKSRNPLSKETHK